MKLYVGNLSFSVTEEQVQKLFSEYGEINEVVWKTNGDKPMGFCYVKMSEESALSAVEHLNGTDFGGRNIRVSEAKEPGDPFKK